LIENFSDGFDIRQSTGFGIFGFINEIKVDLVRFRHPLIRPVREIDGIRMFSVEDILAMKVQAVLSRGRKKDFWDIAKLLQYYSVLDFIDFHKAKNSTQNLMITVPQAITYFDDANDDADPISHKGQTWDSVKEEIQEKVRLFLL
jgi:predicted nucleotidyltransferase component of viral defense system